MRHTPFRAIGFTVLSLAVTSCRADVTADAAATYRNAPSLTLREVVRYCVDEDRPECQLGRETFVNVTGDGGALISASQFGPVARFDSAGRRVATYGRRGRGPGEYQFLAGAHAEAGGRVVLSEGPGARRLLFSEDGSLLHTHTPDLDIAQVHARFSGLRDVRMTARGIAQMHEATGRPGDSVDVEIRVLADTFPARVVARLRLTRQNDASGSVPLPTPFVDRPRWAVEAASTVLLASGPTLRVDRLNVSGDRATVVAAPSLGNRPVTDADLDAYFTRRDSTRSGASFPGLTRQQVNRRIAEARVSAAEFHPFASTIVALNDGAFLIRETEASDAGNRWTMFEPDGRPVGQFRRSGGWIVGGDRHRLLVVSLDGRDVPIVAWFDVVHPVR